MPKCFIIIFLMIGNIIWGQNLLNQTVFEGNINHLNKIIKIEQLVEFSKNDLRILRNTIFAKYGYKFVSNDLKEHFSQFSWYNGIVSNVDNKLTIIDKENIELIQKIERNYPENNKFINDLIGNWYMFGAVASEGMDSLSTIISRGEQLQILPNGIYIIHCRAHVRNEIVFYGLWSLKNYTFETVPIGEHIGHGIVPTYGKVDNFYISSVYSIDGNEYPSISPFNHGSWVKELNKK